MGKLKDIPALMGSSELTASFDLWKALLAEFIGTLFLVFIGCGSCLGDSTTVQIALAFGITVATMAQSIGHVSGCHINPAITLAMLAARYVSVIRALLYILVQCLGGITGAALLMAVIPSSQRGSLGMTSLTHVNAGQGFGIEFLITFVVVFIVFGVSDERRNDIKGSAPLAIGLSITACHLFAVPLTGSSINPARSFGPAVVMALWDDHWVFWAGPILGGLAAGLIYSYVFRAAKETYVTSNNEMTNVKKAEFP